MPTIKEVAEYMESIAPSELAEDWDNPGLLVDAGGDAAKILVALDITLDVVREAEAGGFGLVVAHHPVIFRPLKSLQADSAVFALARAGVSALCAHTNLDAAPGGVNDVLAGVLGLGNVQPFEPLGRMGALPQEMTPEALATMCANKLAATVQLASAGKPLRNVAVVGGSGGNYWRDAMNAGADCLLTGEAGHHEGLDAVAAGFTLLAAGHYATEYPVVPDLARRLQERFADAKVQVAKAGTDPYVFVSQGQI